ncbi:SCF-associated factor 1 [[Candida] anglica]|uniref:SCF-associated factor 1 n=1 Tax=[Candida] anglica TaxID=148631 RepID=A0ABP0E7P1_9ASCO
MIGLSDLGEDVIVWNIAPYLEASDIFSLSLTSKQFRSILTTNETYHLLYRKKFSSNPAPLSVSKYHWDQLFALRASTDANVYTWGCNTWWRLGHDNSGESSSMQHSSFIGQSVPRLLKAFNNSIVTDISSGGFSFQFLTNNGDLYWSGQRWHMDSLSPPAPKGKDYEPPITSRNNIRHHGNRRANLFGPPGIRQRVAHDTFIPVPQIHSETPVNLRRPPEEQNNVLNSNPQPPLIEKENRYIGKLQLPKNAGKLVSISSGREHIIGLDTNGDIFTWDSGCPGTLGVRLQFPNVPKSTTFVSKVSAGWNLSVCHFVGFGLVAWYGRDNVTELSYKDGSMIANAHYVVIPGTAGHIIDFMAGEDYIIFIKSSGLLFRFDIDARAFSEQHEERLNVDHPYQVLGFNRWLARHNEELVIHGAKFSKITGCYNNVAVFTDDSMVLIGHRGLFDSESEPEIIPELQKRNIRHVVMGDYHYLALTDEGDLLAWGRESQRCGCLGVGPLGTDEVVSVPRLVEPPRPNGRWLAVTAAGWHSGGIFIEVDENK